MQKKWGVGRGILNFSFQFFLVIPFIPVKNQQVGINLVNLVGAETPRILSIFFYVVSWSHEMLNNKVTVEKPILI